VGVPAPTVTVAVTTNRESAMAQNPIAWRIAMYVFQSVTLPGPITSPSSP
jgi:hypothetical protein